MKIRSKAALFLLALAAGVALAPLLLRLEQVQSAVVRRLQNDLPFEVQLGALRWQWWPLPHLTVEEVRIDARRWHLTAPSVEYHPGWASWFSRKETTGRIVLKHPAVQLADNDHQDPAAPSAFPLPHLAVTVEDGTLSVPAGLLPFPVVPKRLNVTGLSGRIEFSPDVVAVRASAASSFCQAMEVHGTFHPETAAYRFEVESRGLEFHKAVSSLAGGRILPGQSMVDLRGRIEGVGPEFRADLNGEFPCFVVRPQEHPLLVTCGLADLSLSQSASSLTLTITSLDLKDPGLTLQGKIVRSRPDMAAPPQWNIDLTARQVDLGAIREKALSLWGSEHLVQEITQVVRGGKAPVLSFRFAGPASDLHHVEAITIEGQLEKTRLLVPEVELDLDDVRGDFAIREGRLSGRHLSARLGPSEGRNGTFLLALTGDRKDFLLDLDLEAEVAALPTVLHQTVHHEAFLSEVDRFSELAGRVRGHLHVGDQLRHPIVDVRVDELKASGRYGRLSWPFHLEGGRLEVKSDRQVAWHGVKGLVGPHQVAETTGAVSWGEEKTLDISSFQADLAAAPLYAELIRYPLIKRKLSAVLSAVSGKVAVIGGTFHGPLQRPKEWQYEAQVEGRGVTWASPLLGVPVSTRSLSGSLSHQEAVVAASQNHLLGQEISLQGRFRHRRLDHWRGWVELDGVADRRVAAWVRGKGWVPPTFFPRVPCLMDKLRIGWGPGYLSLNGGIVAGNRPQGLPRVDIDLRKTGQELAVRRVAISAAEEYGLLALDLPGERSAGFELSWRGNLDTRTVDALLESNTLLNGRVAGVCTFRYVPGQPEQTRLVGTLQADDFLLPLSGPEPFLIKRLQASGNGANLDIPLLEMTYGGEYALAKGRVAATPEGLELDLALSSPVVSWTALERLQHISGKPEGPGWRHWDLRGRISFEIDQLLYAAGGIDPEDASGSGGLRFEQLHGGIDLQDGESWRIGVDSAGICGLALNGSWSSSGEEETGLIHLRSDPQAPPAFEKVMPCLGSKQDLVVGEFSLDATLRGRPGHWTDGEARLESAHGNIRRLTLLSKVFSVINLTDLFAEAGPNPVTGGLPYSTMDIEAKVADDHLVFEKAVVRGEGLNLFGRGNLDLTTFQADLTVLIAPFKTLDAIVSSVPVIGRVIGGENATLITIPVGVEGPVSDPSVMVLAPGAVGESVLLLVKDTLTLPFTLLSPIFPNGDE